MKKLLLSIIVIAVVAANSLAAQEEAKLPPSKQTKLGLYVTTRMDF